MNNRVDNVYNSITKKEVIKIFLIGGLIGAVFFLMCYGWQILDVTNDGWLLSGEDISQHYIGWKFYIRIHPVLFFRTQSRYLLYFSN